MYQRGMSQRDALARAVGAGIRRIREAHGMTQEQFCDATGYDQSYLSQLETGKKFGSLQTLAERMTRAGLDPLEVLRSVPGEDDASPEVLRAARAVERLPYTVRSAVIDALDALSDVLSERADDELAEVRDLLAAAKPSARESMIKALKLMAAGGDR